jgi:hypothetical protein
MDESPLSIAQIATVIFGVLIVYEQLMIYILDRKEWKRALNASSWAVHLLIFYTLVFLDATNVIDVHVNAPHLFTIWSPYLRLHSAVAFYLVTRSTHTFMLLNKKFLLIRAKFSIKGEIAK